MTSVLAERNCVASVAGVERRINIRALPTALCLISMLRHVCAPCTSLHALKSCVTTCLARDVSHKEARGNDADPEEDLQPASSVQGHRQQSHEAGMPRGHIPSLLDQ
jgi:hypothetical protein